MAERRRTDEDGRNDTMAFGCGCGKCCFEMGMTWSARWDGCRLNRHFSQRCEPDENGWALGWLWREWRCGRGFSKKRAPRRTWFVSIHFILHLIWPSGTFRSRHYGSDLKLSFLCHRRRWCHTHFHRPRCAHICSWLNVQCWKCFTTTICLLLGIVTPSSPTRRF